MPEGRSEKSVRIKWGVMAACLTFVIYAGVRFAAQKIPGDNASGLPMLTISENAEGSMGFEGFLAYDISELINRNPWNETTELSTLPVYKNQLVLDETYQV